MLRWWIFFLFILLPIGELALLLEVGRRIGTWPAVMIVFGTGIVGAAAAQVQGFAVLARIQDALAAGRMPAEELLHGFLVLVGALLLVLPGLITDAVGFCLLIPFTRHAAVERAKRWLRERLEQGSFYFYFRG